MPNSFVIGESPLIISTSIGFASNYTKEGHILFNNLLYTEVVDEIDANRPLVLYTRFNYKNKDGKVIKEFPHAMVCGGYRTTNNNIYIYDPAKKLTGYCNYSQLLTGGLISDNYTVTCESMITAKFKEK